MGKKPNYTKEEIEYLENNWGRKSMTEIANELNRSINGIKLKAERLGLGGILNADEYLSAKQIADILDKQANTIMRWVKNKGLKGKIKIMANGKERGVWRIKLEDLMEWLKNNQEWFDARKIIPFNLGTEPDWLKQKRVSDRKNWRRKFEKWTKREENLLWSMYKSGEKLSKLAKKFDRSYCSIERKVSRLRNKKIEYIK